MESMRGGGGYWSMVEYTGCLELAGRKKAVNNMRTAVTNTLSKGITIKVR